LANVGILKVGQALDRMALGDENLLAIEGFGRKSLADLKRRLKARGFQLPEAQAEPQT
jgi:DNA-directed RNA polymerase alpha subunit